MSVLIVHPDLELGGGVSSYFRQLKDEFHEPVMHYVIGHRKDENKLIIALQRLFSDYYGYTKRLSGESIDLVHLNPSLDAKAVIRDGILAVLARMKKKKVVVFIHGWTAEFETQIDKRFLWCFRFLYAASDAFIVLSNDSRDTLIRWGIKKPIFKEVTAVSDKLLTGFSIDSALHDRNEAKIVKILFMARIVKKKGVFDAIDTLSHLGNSQYESELTIAGEGDDLEKAMAYVSDNHISNVRFVGYVKGEAKRQLLEESHIFFMPTSHGEGFPVAIAEAMAFGLPILTRPVGGIADSLKDGKNGLITASRDPKIFSELLDHLVSDRKLYNDISLVNYRFAQERLLASKATKRLETIYRQLIESV
jgi:glycosyltransferase involved in cell wall biosynthesis